MSSAWASLPMYDWPELRHETDHLWSMIGRSLESNGLLAPSSLRRKSPTDWLDPNMLLSQTCGYPVATRLSGKVQLLGTPVYSAEGCSEENYCSAIIVRADQPAESLQSAGHLKFAYNAPESLSGYRCLFPLIGNPVAYFVNSVVSGAHRKSLELIAGGDADIAAIDAVCWHLFRRIEPAIAAELRVLSWGPHFPALPFVTNFGVVPNVLGRIRSALRDGVGRASGGLELLPLRDVKFVPAEVYSPLADLN